MKTIKELLAEVRGDIKRFEGNEFKGMSWMECMGQEKGILDATASFRAMLIEDKFKKETERLSLSTTSYNQFIDNLLAQLPDEVKDG